MSGKFGKKRFNKYKKCSRQDADGKVIKVLLLFFVNVIIVGTMKCENNIQEEKS